jgi:hypothetical protein
MKISIPSATYINMVSAMFLQVLIMASAFPCFSLIQHGGKPAEKQIGHLRNISCFQCVASAFRCPDPSRKVTRFSPQNFHIFGSNIHRQYAIQKCPSFALAKIEGKPAEKQIGHPRNTSYPQCVASTFCCPDPSRKVTRFSPQNFHIFVFNILRQYAIQKHLSFALAKIGGKPAEKQIGHLRNTSYPQCVASVFCCPDPFRKVTRFSTVYFRNILHIYCKSKIKCTFALYTWKQQDNKDRIIIIKTITTMKKTIVLFIMFAAVICASISVNAASH